MELKSADKQEGDEIMFLLLAKKINESEFEVFRVSKSLVFLAPRAHLQDPELCSCHIHNGGWTPPPHL